MGESTWVQGLNYARDPRKFPTTPLIPEVNFGTPFATTAVDYQLLDTDKYLEVDASGGNRTVTLPGYVAYLNGTEYYVFKNGNNDTNTVTIQRRQVGDDVNGLASLVLRVPHSGLRFVCEGSNGVGGTWRATPVGAGDLLALRRLMTPMTAYATGANAEAGLAVALSAGWGNTATITFDANSNDVRGRASILAQGTGIAGSPSIAFTFKDGAFFPIAPLPIICSGSGVASQAWAATAYSTTGWTALFPATPTSGQTYRFQWGMA